MAATEERRKSSRLKYEHLLAQRLAGTKAEAAGRGPNSRRQRELDQKSAEATGEFKATQDELDDRAPNSRLESPIIFWSVALIILVTEAMFNRVVIEMAAPVPAWFALLISFVASAVLVWFAHIAGMLLRQMWSELNRSVYWMNVILGLFLIALDVVSVLAIVALRGYFTTVDLTTGIDIFQAASTILRLDTGALALALTIPEAVTLGAINVLCLVLAFLIGMISHDSEREFDTRYKQMKKADSNVARAVETYEHRLDVIFRRYARPIAKAGKTFVANGGAIAELPADDFKAQRAEAESSVLVSAAESTSPRAEGPLRAVSGSRGLKGTP